MTQNLLTGNGATIFQEAISFHNLPLNKIKNLSKFNGKDHLLELLKESLREKGFPEISID